MTSLPNLNSRLRKHRLEYAALCEYHENIHLLIRLATAGLLFETDRQSFFSIQVLPVIDKLLGLVKLTYGVEHPALQQLSSQDISLAIQTLDNLLLSDIDAALTNDPATDDALEIILCYPGFKAIRYHRIAHIFYRRGIPLLPRMIAELAHEKTGIDIHPGAVIGPHFFIDHGTGVVIGESAVIGSGVTIYQGVTLGAKRFYRDDSGTVVKGQPRHPIIGDAVTIYAGATILGRISIGAESSIGGNVWLTESIPQRSRVTQQRYLSSYFTDGDGI